MAPVAGRYSPLVLRLKRENGSQRFGDLSLALPPGLSARLAGLRECSAAQIAAAVERGSIGEGALERRDPSCPPASEVGLVTVGAGTGTPLYLSGRTYLSGPYRGAPLSLAMITPAMAGPFDLGAVVVRAALRVDPRTARLTVATDPLPAIVRGVPLGIRSIAIDLNRPGFILNPTSCDPMAVNGAVTSLAGQVDSLSNRFQVGGCSQLPFKPKLSMRLLGPTHRGAHPGLRATLFTRRGDANLRRVRAALPTAALLDSRHIRAVCSREQLAAHACPAASVVGHVRTWTPLLDAPLEGPVFLRTSAGRLPGLTARLHGQVDLELSGSLSSAQGRLWVGFGSLPDVPLDKLVLNMRGGKRGLLVNTGGVCAPGTRVAVRLRSQSGRSRELSPQVRTDCGT